MGMHFCKGMRLLLDTDCAEMMITLLHSYLDYAHALTTFKVKVIFERELINLTFKYVALL